MDAPAEPILRQTTELEKLPHHQGELHFQLADVVKIFIRRCYVSYDFSEHGCRICLSDLPHFRSSILEKISI
jgi:hypothetical protein